MSVLVRFNSGQNKYKARMFEQGSRRDICQICGERKFGILFRTIEPIKHERLICHECLLKIAEGLQAKPNVDATAPVVQTTVPKAAKKSKPKAKKKPLFNKLKGQANVRKEAQEACAQGDGGTSSDQQGQILS
jgi:hypothetical protein